MDLVRLLPPYARLLLRRIRLSFTVLSLFVGALTIVIMMVCRSQQSSKYTLFLLSIVLLTTSQAVYLNLIADPVALFPAPCMSRDDPIINIAGTGATHFGIWSGIRISVSPFFLQSLIYRYKAVQMPGARSEGLVIFINCLSAFVMLESLLIPIVTQFSLQPIGSISNYEKMFSLDLPVSIFDHADCFTEEFFFIEGIGAVVFGSIGVLIYIHISMRTFVALGANLKLSDKMRTYHRTMTKALLIQSSVPLVISISPLIAIYFVALVEWNGIWSVPILFTIISSHPFIQSIVFLVFTPAYRRRIAGFLGSSNVSKEIRSTAMELS